MTRLPDTAHTGHPWRIHALTRDFRLEDVWAIRTPGAGPDDFPAVLAAVRSAAESGKGPLPLRFLFAVRRRLGALLGWDKPAKGVGARVTALRDQLPEDLRGPVGEGLGQFTPVYRLADECAFEGASSTSHMVMHLSWAPVAGGGYELRMAVLVKPNGGYGRRYLAAIKPFRRRIVFPGLTRQWERAWRDRGRPRPDAPAATVHGVVGPHRIPEHLRALHALTRLDYADAFTLGTDAAPVDEPGQLPAGATAEQWARAMFGDVPDLAERFIWHGLLRLRLSPGRSPRTVAGWRIAARGEDWIRLEATSWFLAGNLVVRAAGGTVSLGTFLRYDRWPGRVVWGTLAPVHRRLSPGLFHDALATLRTSPTTEHKAAPR